MFFIKLFRTLAFVLIPLWILCMVVFFFFMIWRMYIKNESNSPIGRIVAFAARTAGLRVGRPLGEEVVATTVGAVYVQPAPEEKLRYVQKGTAEWSTMCDLMKVTDPHNLGVGRDVAAASGESNSVVEDGRQEQQSTCKTKYSTLKPVHAWRVCTQESINIYGAHKSKVQRDIATLQQQGISHPAVRTKLDPLAGKLKIDVGATERVLLHGTTPDHIESILHNGLNERLSGGVFGDGIYLAEDPSKVDQYCVPDTGSAALNDILYTVEPRCQGEVFYCFAVRAVLGMAVCTIDGEYNCNEPTQNVFANDGKRDLACVPGSQPPLPYHTLVVELGAAVKRHREFVVFNGDRTCVEYLIAYVRE